MIRVSEFLSFLIVMVVMPAAAVAQISTADSERNRGKAHGRHLVIPSGTLIRLTSIRRISSRTTKRGDPVDLRLREPLFVGHRVIVPAETLIQGSVVRIKRPGFIARRARLRIHLDTLILRGNAFDVSMTDLKVKGGTTLGRKALSALKTAATRSVSPAAGVLVGSGTLTRRGPDIEVGPRTFFLTRLVEPLEIPLEMTRPAKGFKQQCRP